MKLGLINTAWLGTALEGRPGLEKAREIGFDVVDIAADPLDISASERARLLADVAEVGLPVASVPCVAAGLGDFNPSVRRFHVDRVKRHVDLARDLGAANVLYCLGEYVWEQQVIPPEAQWQWSVESTREVGDYAAGHGLEVVIELEPFRYSIVNTIDTMDAFLAAVDHPAVKANVDCSHLWLMRIDASEIGRLRGRIGHAHISDCDGETHGDLPPGRGNTPLRSYLEGLRDTGFDGALSVELEYSPEPGLIVEWVTEAYRETDALMVSVGVRERCGPE
jgi:sugar phosphate isomerase/epimerase